MDHFSAVASSEIRKTLGNFTALGFVRGGMTFAFHACRSSEVQGIAGGKIMVVSSKPLLALTAGDLMSEAVVTVPRQMSLSVAARLLSQARVTGAPVVDERGQCIGVLSATDFLHRAQEGQGFPSARSCTETCYSAAWQMIRPESLPAETVANIMTRDPVTVSPGTGIGELARMMRDAHIHRVIVVDAEQRPTGIVSSTDLLAALANEAGQHPQVEPVY
jgi:CBS-domain-containing membrane protein